MMLNGQIKTKSTGNLFSWIITCTLLKFLKYQKALHFSINRLNPDGIRKQVILFACSRGNDIEFLFDWSNHDCIVKRPLKFDFYIP